MSFAYHFRPHVYWTYWLYEMRRKLGDDGEAEKCLYRLAEEMDELGRRMEFDISKANALFEKSRLE